MPDQEEFLRLGAAWTGWIGMAGLPPAVEIPRTKTVQQQVGCVLFLQGGARHTMETFDPKATCRTQHPQLHRRALAEQNLRRLGCR